MVLRYGTPRHPVRIYSKDVRRCNFVKQCRVLGNEDVFREASLIPKWSPGPYVTILLYRYIVNLKVVSTTCNSLVL